MTVAIGSVIAASASAVAKVFVIGTIGYVAAIRPRPILPQHAMNAISKMNFDLLVLPLIYTTIASAVTPEKLGSLWFILVSAVGVICLSYGVASFLGMMPLFKIENKTDFVALRVAATFPNIVALPILIFPTLCEFPAVYNSFYEGDNHDNDSTSDVEKSLSCTEQSNAMIFIYFFAWNLVYWIVGHPTLIAAGKKRQLNTASSQIAITEHRRSVDSFESEGESIQEQDNIDQSGNSDHEEGIHEAGDMQPDADQSTHLFQKTKTRIKDICHLIANGVLNTMKSPGFLAMVFGFITACIPPLRNSLFSPGGALRFLGSALESLGSASAAVGTLIVAASLVHQASEETPVVGNNTDSLVCQSQEVRDDDITQSHGEVSTSRDFRAVIQRRRSSISQFSIKTMAAIRRRKPTLRMHAWFFFSRHIVTPAIVCLIILAMDCGSVLDGVPSMAKMVVIVNSGLPGAQLIVLTLKAKGLSDSASIVAKVYLPSYLLSVITIAAWTSLGLLISQYDSTPFCKR